MLSVCVYLLLFGHGRVYGLCTLLYTRVCLCMCSVPLGAFVRIYVLFVCGRAGA